MSLVFITGSTDGLGLAAARSPTEQGHDVVGHARNAARASDLRQQVPTLRAVLVADLASVAATEELADEANGFGRFDAVIHNAGVGYRERRRIDTVDGHSHVLAINVLAPYVLTARMTPPHRLIYMSSGMHRGGNDSVIDLDWLTRPWDGSQAYADSKLFDATLAAAAARRWPDVLSNAVEPGWVPTKMGGTGAPDDLDQAHVTQCWLAVSDDTEVLSGGYYYHQRLRPTHPAVRSRAFQDDLTAQLASLTGVELPS